MVLALRLVEAFTTDRRGFASRGTSGTWPPAGLLTSQPTYAACAPMCSRTRPTAPALLSPSLVVVAVSVEGVVGAVLLASVVVLVVVLLARVVAHSRRP